jgi:hypothetical protein
MKKIEMKDIKDIADYEKIRRDFRNKIIEIKRRRRLQIGDRISLTFENRYTVIFQIEEMMRAERIVEDEKINSEIDVYNELIPDENELSATLFVEVDQQDLIKPVLDSLVGLNKDSVFLQIGDRKIPAIFEEGHATDDRISAVQYVRFKLSKQEMKDFMEVHIPVRVLIKHKNYSAEALVPEDTRRALIEDLTMGSSVNVWD